MSLIVLGFVFFVIFCVLERHFFFKYPIKQDRYGHAFSRHFLDRATAYLLLLRSPLRTQNATVPLEVIQQMVTDTAAAHGVDPCLVSALVAFESAYNPNTITTTGAIGLMALQPTTAKMLRVADPFNPRRNIDGGTRLVKQLSEMFGGDVPLILAAYNAGPGAVRRYNGVPPFRETQDYVRHVGEIYRLCKGQKSLDRL